MNLVKENRFIRYSMVANFFNQFGSSLYNIVFIIYVATTFHSKLYISVANMIIMVPIFFQLWIAQKADETELKSKWIIRIGWIQGCFFFVIAFLTGKVSLFAFSIICFLNIISDCLSCYQSSLYTPIFSHQVHEEQLLEAYSLNNIIGYICVIGGQTTGVWILNATHQQFKVIAILNAISFILSSLIFWSIKDDLRHGQVLESSKTTFFKKIKATYQLAIQTFNENEKVSFRWMFVCIVLMNVLSTAISPILLIYYLDHSLFRFSYGESILLLQIVGLVFGILGNLHPEGYFAQKSLVSILKMSTVVLVVTGFIGILNLPSIFIILLSGGDAFLTGKFNPKLSAFWAKSIPENQLAQVRTLISTVVMAAIPLGTVVFSALASYSVKLSWFVFFGISMGVMISIVSYKGKEVD